MTTLAAGAAVELEVADWSYVSVHTTCDVQCGGGGTATVLKNGDGDPLATSEEVDVSRLRPVPPSTRSERDAKAPLSDFLPGSVVDVFVEGAWWVGTVLSGNRRSLSVGHPPPHLDVTTVFEITDVRHSRVWDGATGAWSDRPPVPVAGRESKPQRKKGKRPRPTRKQPQRRSARGEDDAEGEDWAAPRRSGRTKVETEEEESDGTSESKSEDAESDGGSESEEAVRKKKKAAVMVQAEKRRFGVVETARLAHNAAMDVETRAAAPLRAATLGAHLSVLKHFLPQAVAARLRAAAEEAPPLDAAGEADMTILRTPPAALELGAPVPPQITASLRPHQLIGFRWLAASFARGLNPILGDEMGLGKTLQTICLLAHLSLNSPADPGSAEELPNAGGPHLVVCPLSVLPSWMSELNRWCPQLRVVRAHSGDTAERERVIASLADVRHYDVAVTTYEMVKAKGFANALQSRCVWRTLTLDEGHRAKNEAAQVSAALRSVRRRCTLLLSGTLLQNNMRELWALLNLLYPKEFVDDKVFEKSFVGDGAGGFNADSSALLAANAMLKVLCLRREKADVDLGLPPKVETRVLCPLSETQTLLYRALLLRNAEMIDAGASARGADLGKLRNICMQLRMICGHPNMVLDEDEPEPEGEEAEAVEAELQIAASGKLKVLDRLLRRLKAAGHRVVLFSQFTCVLDVLQAFCITRNYAFARLDGSVGTARRALDIMQFNRKHSSLFIFMASTRAGGLGINLQTADTVILFDSDWNPQQDVQAMARVHRIGQTKPVAIFRLVTGGSVEERILARADRKLYLDAVVSRGEGITTADELDEEVEGGFGVKALAATLKFGADQLFRSAAGREPSDEELDALCDRSESGEARRAALAGLRMTEARTHDELATAPPMLSTYVMEGYDYRADSLAAKAAALAAAETAVRELAPRDRQGTTVMVDGHAILKANMYSLTGGEPSVWDGEAQRKGYVKPDAEHKRVGKKYVHADCCQICWEGGELFLCEFCPAAYHALCLGQSKRELEKQNFWQCPHHRCEECQRGPSAVGGLLFRCECCSSAFCFDHLPPAVMDNGWLVDKSARFLHLGQEHPTTATFIHCSKDCVDFAADGYNGYGADWGCPSGPPPPSPIATVKPAPVGSPWRRHRPVDEAGPSGDAGRANPLVRD